MGLGLLAFASVRLNKAAQGSRHSPAASIRAAVATWPQVVARYAMSGESGYLLRVQARDLDAYSRFVMDHLLKYPVVLDVQSSFVLERIKETTTLPLGHCPASLAVRCGADPVMLGGEEGH